MITKQATKWMMDVTAWRFSEGWFTSRARVLEISSHHLEQQFKTYELFISRIFRLICCNSSRLWETETKESETPGKGVTVVRSEAWRMMGTSEWDLDLDLALLQPSYVTLGKWHKLAKLCCPQLRMGTIIAPPLAAAVSISHRTHTKFVSVEAG